MLDPKVSFLNRSISFPVLVLYGMGTMIGGGIYALLGKVAGVSGVFMPVAFLISALVACLTALSYARLSSQFPVSAGEAKFVDAAFSSKLLSQIVGLLVVFTGLASVSTLTKAGSGFLFDLSHGMVPDQLGVLLLVCLLAFFCYRDIGLSTKIIACITVVELVGLLAVIGVNYKQFSQFPQFAFDVGAQMQKGDIASLIGVLLPGAFLAFYAFIGFEDMVNVAEEVKEAETTLPKAIIFSFLITSLLYLLISFIAVTAVDLEVLKNAKTPLGVLVSHEAGEGIISPLVMGVISLIAGLNGALVQMIMISRVLYGLSREGKAPRFLSDLHVKYKTPIKSVMLTAWVVLVCALLLPVQSLASYASGIILVVFIFVNLSAVILDIKNRKSDATFGVKTLLSLVAFISCIALCVSIVVSV